MDIQSAPHLLAESVQHVRLSGTPEAETLPRLTETLQFLIRRVSPRILVDIRQTPSPSPAILTLLCRMAEQARAHGGGLAVCGSVSGDGSEPLVEPGLVIHETEAEALARLGIPAVEPGADPVDTTLELPPGGVGRGVESRRGLRQTLSMEFADTASRFSRARTTCVVVSPPQEERRHGIQTEALGRTVVLPRMLPRSGGRPDPLSRMVLAPGFEPVRMWVLAQESYCSCVLQTLDVLRELMGMDASRAERLGRAVRAVFDVACSQCAPTDSLGVEYAWKGRILCATIIVPRNPFALYAHLRPACAPGVQDDAGARRWLETLLGFVDITTEGADTHLLLAPLDTTDESDGSPPDS